MMTARKSPGVADTIVGAPGTVPVIPKVWDTIAAGLKFVSPACEASIVQGPKASIVTFPLRTVQKLSDLETSVTGRPDEEVAVTGIGVELNVCVPGFGNVMT